MKTLVLATAMTLALAFSQAVHAAGEEAPAKGLESAPVLNASISVRGAMIRLGDIFANLDPDKAGVAIAYAPAPGERSTLDARWLMRVSKAYKLGWRPQSHMDKALVTRASHSISRDEIEDHILAALAETGEVESVDQLQVYISNRRLAIHVPVEKAAVLEVEDIAYEPRTKRFSAIVVAPAGDPAAKRLRIAGKVHRVTSVPVLSRRVLPGEVIGERDIEWIKVRSDRLQRDVIFDDDNLLGHTPKRGLSAGRPLRLSQVQRPQLVLKGSLVTIVFQVPNMTLTAQGKVKDNGADGDTVRVVNTRSNTLVEGTVIGRNRVAVRAIDRELMMN